MSVPLTLCPLCCKLNNYAVSGVSMSCYTRLAWPLTLTDVAKILSYGYCNYVSKIFICNNGQEDQKVGSRSFKNKTLDQEVSFVGLSAAVWHIAFILANKIIYLGVFHLLK